MAATFQSAVVISTPQGEVGDQRLFEVLGFEGREALSELYEIAVSVRLSDRCDDQLYSLVGQPIEMLVPAAFASSTNLEQWTPRTIRGICRQIRRVAQWGNRMEYVLSIVPRVWALTQNVRCQVFQEESVPAILERLLQGFSFDSRLSKDPSAYRPHNYCVQYDESDWMFMSRIMEEEGIYYYFRDPDSSGGESGEILVLADHSPASPALPTFETLRFAEAKVDSPFANPAIDGWTSQVNLAAKSYIQADFHFEKPSSVIHAGQTIATPAAISGRGGPQVCQYTGDFAHRVDGVGKNREDQGNHIETLSELAQRYARLKCERTATKLETRQASSNVARLTPGYSFQAENVGEDGSFLVTAVEHRFRADAKNEEFAYQNQFFCLPMSTPFRPFERTAKPHVPGAQTAIVIGPSGQEIWTDKYGRVRVQFPWQRQGDENFTSCWVRVSQPLAGKNWGMLAIPRIGQEVLVNFLDADPDRPIIVGSVYNAEQMPPFQLPQEASRVTLKSDLLNGNNNFHGLTFDDNNGNPIAALRSGGRFLLQAESDSSAEFGGKHVARHWDDDITVVGGLKPFPKSATGLNLSEENGQQLASKSNGTEWSNLKHAFSSWANAGNYVTGMSVFGAVGGMHHFAFGNATTTTINPAGFVAKYGDKGGIGAMGVLLSGLGQSMGKTDVTIGALNSICVGRRVDVYRGGPVYELDSLDCAPLKLAEIAYSLLYPLGYFALLANPQHSAIWSASLEAGKAILVQAENSQAIARGLVKTSLDQAKAELEEATEMLVNQKLEDSNLLTDVAGVKLKLAKDNLQSFTDKYDRQLSRRTIKTGELDVEVKNAFQVTTGSSPNSGHFCNFNIDATDGFCFVSGHRPSKDADKIPAFQVYVMGKREDEDKAFSIETEQALLAHPNKIVLGADRFSSSNGQVRISNSGEQTDIVALRKVHVGTGFAKVLDTASPNNLGAHLDLLTTYMADPGVGNYSKTIKTGAAAPGVSTAQCVLSPSAKNETAIVLVDKNQRQQAQIVLKIDDIGISIAKANGLTTITLQADKLVLNANLTLELGAKQGITLKSPKVNIQPG